MPQNEVCRKKAVYFVALACIAFFITVTVSTTTVWAKKRKGPLWGVQMPAGAKTIQEYRSTATYYVEFGPEETSMKLLSILGGSSNVKVYRSCVGSTLIVFIENKAPKRWSSIQISGTVGRPGSYININREGRGIGWHWSWQESEKRWEPQKRD